MAVSKISDIKTFSMFSGFSSWDETQDFVVETNIALGRLKAKKAQRINAALESFKGKAAEREYFILSSFLFW